METMSTGHRQSTVISNSGQGVCRSMVNGKINGELKTADESKERPLRKINKCPVPIHLVNCRNIKKSNARDVFVDAHAHSLCDVSTTAGAPTSPSGSRSLGRAPHGFYKKKLSGEYDVDNDSSVSYPGIPFQVAKYLCESNPELVERMEAALHVSIGNGMAMSVDDGSKCNRRSREMSPFNHMDFVTDALSLQHSVIGSDAGRRVVPVSADVVAQVVADNVKQYGQQDFSINQGQLDRDDHDQCSKCSSVESSTSSTKELHRFPKERIKTLVERRSWFSAGGKEEELVMSTSSAVANGRELSDINIKWDSAGDSEVESNFSDVAFEDQVNLTIQDNHSQLLDVLREKAALEGQLETVKFEAERSGTEVTQLQSQLATARAQIGAQAALARASNQEVENMRRMLDDADRRLNDSNDLAVGLREALDARAVEVVQSRAETKEVESETRALRIALQETKVDAESREGAVMGLKTKVAEMHAQLEDATRTLSQTECELQACKRECNSESKMKEWYRNQVEGLQQARQAAQRDVLTATADAAEARSSAQRLRFEGERLGKQLADVQQRAVREKENLLRHLETIEADVKEREAAVQQHFDRLDKTGVCGFDGEALVQRIKAVEVERARLAEEAFSRTQLEHQLDVARKELADSIESQGRVEREAAALSSRIVVLQKTVDDGHLQLDAAFERQSRQASDCRELESSLRQSEELVLSLQRDKTSLEVELSAAKKERSDVDTALVEVQANVTKLDGRIRRLREELTERNRSLEELSKEKITLEDELVLRESALDQRRRKESRLDEEVKGLRDEIRRLELVQNTHNVEVAEVIGRVIVQKENVTSEIGCQTIDIDNPVVEVVDEVPRRAKSTIALLTRKLKEAIESKKKVNSEREEAVGKLMLLESERIANADRPTVESTVNKTAFYKKRIILMEKKLIEMQRLYDDEKLRADRNQELLIDAEKEKGRLQALAESTESLRQHASVLEATVAQREKDSHAIETLSADASERSRREIVAKDQRIEELEKRFGHEQSINRDLRRQVFKEMCEAKSLRKNLSNTKELLEETGRLFETSRTRLRTLEDESMAHANNASQLRLERLEIEERFNKASAEIESLRKELEECRAKDEMLADQIKKSQEIVSINEEARANEERHAVQLEAAHEETKLYKREFDIVTAELKACSKEKFAYQARATALKANVEHAKDYGSTPIDRLMESPAPYNESLITSLLQQSIRSLPESRPLSHLRLCVDTLKEEMSILQRQLLDHD